MAANLIATERGYYGGRIIEPGEPFTFAGDWSDEAKRPTWAKLADEGDAETVEAPSAQPEAPAKGKRGKKAETVEAPTAEAFSDAPAPIEAAAGNGVAEALGVEPDWVAPKPIED